MGGASFVRRQLSEPRLRRAWLAGGVTALLTFVPLFGSLGYENGLLTAPLASVLGMAIGLDVVRRWRAAPTTVPHPLPGLVLAGVREVATLAGLAVGVLLVGRLWQRGCDPFGGLLFFVMGPLASALLGLVCGLWGGVVARRPSRKRLAAFAPFAVCLAIGLWRLYTDPVVFAFDPFWGLFSGSVYDEDVGIGPRYLWFRGYNLLAALAALSAWWLFVDPKTLEVRRPRPSRDLAVPALLTLSLTAAAASIGLRPTAFGFTSDMDSITEVLSGTRRTEHFVIHYAPRSPDARNIDAIAAEHEFAWHRLREQMDGRAPEGEIHSFLFQNRDQKRVLMGAGRVQVAAPWRRQIYLDYRGYPHPVIHHELAHIFGATIGDPVFGVSRNGLRFNVGLIEGLATALAPRPADRLDLHDQATVLHRLGKRPPMASIMGPGFFVQSSGVAYTAAGSFCLWLIETYGFEPMAELYRSAGDFEEAYGTSIEQLEEQWLAFLDAREGVRDEDVEAQRQRFERPSVFSRPRAHRVADVAKEIARANQRARFGEAVDAHRDLCELEPERPEHRITLANALVLADRSDEATEVLDEVAATELTATLRANVHERRGDIALWSGDLTTAADAFDAALDLPVSENARRGLQLKRAGASDPTLAPAVVRYFGLYETKSDPVEQAVQRLFEATRLRTIGGYAPLGDYLVARQLLNIQDYASAIAPLQRALDPGPNDRPLPSVEFIREARQMLMTAYLVTARYDEAREVLAQLKAEPDIGNGHRLDYTYWTARIDFYASYAPSPG